MSHFPSMYAGPVPPPPTQYGQVLLRTIYIFNLLGMFTRNKRGTYLKPTEGVKTNSCEDIITRVNRSRGILQKCQGKVKYNSAEERVDDKLSEFEAGMWIWLASTKKTDPDKDKASYIFGAIYVTSIIKTRLFKSMYSNKRRMDQFCESRRCQYQLIVPMEPWARSAQNLLWFLCIRMPVCRLSSYMYRITAQARAEDAHRSTKRH